MSDWRREIPNEEELRIMLLDNIIDTLKADALMSVRFRRLSEKEQRHELSAWTAEILEDLAERLRGAAEAEGARKER